MNKKLHELNNPEREYVLLRKKNRAMLKVVREALWFLENGEIVPNGERHPYSHWFATVRDLRRVIAENDQSR